MEAKAVDDVTPQGNFVAQDIGKPSFGMGSVSKKAT